jgi:hypothetical protein
MKKLFIIVAVAFSACGPGQKEVAEQAKLDSIHKADSVAATLTVTVKADSVKKDTTKVVAK